jgi:hypothetical protein
LLLLLLITAAAVTACCCCHHRINQSINQSINQVAYQEQAEPEAFFVPYTWEVVRAHTAQDLEWFAPLSQSSS